MPAVLATRAPLAGGSPASGAAPVAGAPQHRWLKPGWPLVVIFVPFPLWWALGLSEWICPIMAVPMAVHLLRLRGVRVPRGFGLWLLFLVWVAVGFTLLGVDAYGAVADDSRTRIITWAYRLSWYLTATITMLYVVNMRSEFSTQRLKRIVAWLFVTATFGGLLGVVSPYFEFSSVMELVLPSSVSSIQFVQKMIHPQAAELMQVLGYASPRPEAPFSYTNIWGLNFALTLPFFLSAWCGKDAGWRRWAAGPVLLVAAVPCIYSINRGMWGALAAMALFVAIRAALTGKPAMLGGVIVGALAVVVLLASTPLGDMVSARFSNEGSEQGRTHLGTLTVESVTRTSPIVGLGSTRNVQGNFNSITGGSTAQCPRCSPPSLGTQGQIWLVVFSQGLVGLVLFLSFFGLVFLRHIRLRSPTATMSLAVLVAAAVTLPVYNSLGVGLVIEMIAVGLLVREMADARGDVPGHEPISAGTVRLDRYLLAVRGALPFVVACGACGVAAGGLWIAANPSPFKATASILVPPPPRYPLPGDGAMTVDSDAQTIASDAVTQASAAASGLTLREAADAISVTATPNTRVLHLTFTAPSATRAQAGVDAAVSSYLDERLDRLTRERNAQVTALEAQAVASAAAIQVLNDALAVEASRGVRGRAEDRVRVLRDKRAEIVTQSSLIGQQTARVLAGQLSAGRQTTPTLIHRSSDRTRVALVSGGTAGLGLGGALAVLVALRGPRVRQLRDIREMTGLPVLARTTYAPMGRRTLDALVRSRPVTYVAADERDAVAAGMAHTLTDLGPQGAGQAAVVVVASDRTRVDDVVSTSARLSLGGRRVHGLVIATPMRTRRRGLTL